MDFNSLLSDHAIHIHSIELNSLVGHDIFLFPDEEIQLSKLLNEKRKKEFLAVRKLRNELLIKSPIGYNEVGKPYLINEPKSAISISHSRNLVTLCKAPFNIGIDVEVAQNRIHKIIDKFANNHEKNLYTSTHFSLTEWYTLIWCAKEAIYKLGGLKGVGFKEQIQIERIVVSESEFIKLSALFSAQNMNTRTIDVFGSKFKGHIFALAKFKDWPSS
jgi:phosphopantetheinyl transferase